MTRRARDPKTGRFVKAPKVPPFDEVHEAEVKAQRLQRAMPELHAELTTLQALSDSYAEVVQEAQAHLGIEQPRVMVPGPNSGPLG